MKTNKNQLEQVLSLEQIRNLCQSPTNLNCLKRNDKLLETVLLMDYLGLRVSEAINFTWQQIFVEDKSAFIVLSKGQKQRLVFNLLNNHYINKKSKLTTLKDEWKSISRVAVWDYLKRKSSEMNLSWNITPHTLRRSFASILNYDLGLDSSSIQQLLGHSQFKTTEKYLIKRSAFSFNQLTA
ncbi:MAG: Tyrosine recombinase XerD [Mycoplasmataceae bacterium]|nr:MAG: Tyrosine recombinase XerD [Mycoplasmataceae bacterium]